MKVRGAGLLRFIYTLCRVRNHQRNMKTGALWDEGLSGWEHNRIMQRVKVFVGLNCSWMAAQLELSSSRAVVGGVFLFCAPSLLIMLCAQYNGRVSCFLSGSCENSACFYWACKWVLNCKSILQFLFVLVDFHFTIYYYIFNIKVALTLVKAH